MVKSKCLLIELCDNEGSSAGLSAFCDINQNGLVLYVYADTNFFFSLSFPFLAPDWSTLMLMYIIRSLFRLFYSEWMSDEISVFLSNNAAAKNIDEDINNAADRTGTFIG